MGKKLLLRLIGLATLSLGCLAVGCGTVCNLAGGVLHPDEEPKVYGGMQRDIDLYTKLINGSSPGGFHPNSSPSGSIAAAALLGLFVAEPAVSFVGDTLTLPITLLAQHCREAKVKAESEKPAGPEESPVTLGTPEVEAEQTGEEER